MIFDLLNQVIDGIRDPSGQFRRRGVGTLQDVVCCIEGHPVSKLSAGYCILQINGTDKTCRHRSEIFEFKFDSSTRPIIEGIGAETFESFYNVSSVHYNSVLVVRTS